MALRILSGLIFANPNTVPQGGGFATITFNPFELAASTGGVVLHKAKAIGPTADFRSRPAAIISAREFFLGGGSGNLSIGDQINAAQVTITWAGPGAGTVHEEIPFMVIGEVSDTPKSRAKAKKPRKKGARR